MHLEESASDGGGCRRRAPRWEGVELEETRGSQTLSSHEEARSGETEMDGIRAPGVCTLFRVSARAGNMTAVTSA